MGVITAALSQDSNDDNAQPRGNSYTTVYTWLPMLHQTQAYKDISLSLYIFDWKPLCHVKLRSNKFLYLSLVNLSFATEVSAIPLCSVKQSNYPLYPQSAQAEKQAGPRCHCVCISFVLTSVLLFCLAMESLAVLISFHAKMWTQNFTNFVP